MENIRKRLSQNGYRWLFLALYFFIVFSMIFNNEIFLAFRTFAACFLYLYAIYWQVNYLKENDTRLSKEIIKILNEILNFLVFTILTSLLFTQWYRKLTGDPVSVNEEQINNALNANKYYALTVVIFGPILEEVVFRFLPYKAFKNKTIFVLVSGFIFALLHCITSPNILIHLPLYLPFALYLGYRYCKTEDIFVTMAIHMFSNFMVMYF